jgi:hypothetical protein
MNDYLEILISRRNDMPGSAIISRRTGTMAVPFLLSENFLLQVEHNQNISVLRQHVLPPTCSPAIQSATKTLPSCR